MNNGLISFYQNKFEIQDYKNFELFEKIYTEYNYANLKHDFIYLKCNKIVKEYIKKYEQQLFDSLTKIEIDCSTFLQKWLKYVFYVENFLMKILFVFGMQFL